MGGGKEMSSARERVLSSMVLASAFFCPSEHFSAQLSKKVLPSAFFGFDKTPPKPSAFVHQNSQKSAKGTPVRRTSLTRVLTQGQKDNVLPYVCPELLNTVMGIRIVLKCPNKVHQRVQRELAVILT